jgi:hypothetical protein
MADVMAIATKKVEVTDFDLLCNEMKLGAPVS